MNENFNDSDRKEIMDIIRKELYTLDTGELKKLGWSIGRSYSCLVAIRSGRSEWPHAKTIFPLCRALGLKFALIDARKMYKAKSVAKSFFKEMNGTMQ